MTDCSKDTLVEIRDILSGLHDRRVNKNVGLSLLEMAALRDTIRRINEILSDDGVVKSAKIIMNP